MKELNLRILMLKNNPRLLFYFAVFFVNMAAIFLAWQLNESISIIQVYLLFIITVIISIWAGGYLSGIFSVFVLLPVLAYLFADIGSISTVIDILLFVVASALTIWLIEKYRRTDIDNKHKEEILKYQAKVLELESQNKIMNQEIKLRDEFLSIASHELKTPLTSMLLKLQTVLHNIRSVSLANFSVENLLKMLETAEDQTKRLSRMINDLLNISLITTGRMNMEPSKSDLGEVVTKVVDEFSEKAEKDGCILKLSVEQNLDCHIDKLRIEQVISNLISNAIKYGNSKPVEIVATKKNSHAIIVVKDNGIGIDAKNKDKIFGLFERGVEKTNYKGLGVGLYIANQIIKAHGGNIKVRSKPGAGSTFTVALPLNNK
jgi:signal transduction histidine kinase